jgi:hypothetical protein
MNKTLNFIVGLVVILVNILIAGYFLIYLIASLKNPQGYPLEKLQWFVYFFIWEIWLDFKFNKFTSNSENSEDEN